MKSYSYLDKIRLSCLTSKGYFLTSQVTHSHLESNAFYIFKTRNTNYFQEIFRNHRTIIYRAQPAFYARFGISNFNQDHDSNSYNREINKVGVLQNLAWFSFCLDRNLTTPVPEICIEINGETLFLDDFSDAILEVTKLKIITLPFREYTILNAGSFPLVGLSLHNKWSLQCLDEFFFGPKNRVNTRVRPEKLSSEKPNTSSVKNDLPPITDEYFWPSDDKKCHQDVRQYSGLPMPISGQQKMFLDQMFIKNSKGLPSNYCWGVYKN
ncbi:MAG: hypothetical protein HQK53_05675 [Oligoflexia bacterium]|nr:hypothetical protein [Oligoflexia bacterium]